MSVNHTLYRFRAADGKLLYVGKTANPGARFAKHGLDHSWWRAVATITLEHYANNELLTQAERQAIRNERPYFNTAFNDARGVSHSQIVVRAYNFPSLRTTIEPQ